MTQCFPCISRSKSSVYLHILNYYHDDCTTYKYHQRTGLYHNEVSGSVKNIHFYSKMKNVVVTFILLVLKIAVHYTVYNLP